MNKCSEGRLKVMAERVILHCDLNNFFASVSLLYNPTLYNLPVAVTGSQKERHGIVLAKNEIAKKFGAHISHFDWVNDFSKARNFSLEQSECDWNLVLDADEYLISGKRKDIEKFLDSNEAIGYVERIDYYKEEDGTISKSKTFIPRIMPKGVNYRGAIHEQVDSQFKGIQLPLVFDHDGYLQDGKGERNLEMLLEQYKEDITAFTLSCYPLCMQ